MKTLTGLLPLAIGIAVVGAATWLLLDRDWALGPWLLAGLLFAHGWVHLMFVFPKPEPQAASAGGLAWPFDMSRSWLVTEVGLDVGLVRTVGIVLMLVVFMIFLVAAISGLGLVVPVDWWAGRVVGAALGSTLLLAMFFSPTLLLGFGINLALVWLVLSSAWLPTGTGLT
jgi:hypothetical protein